jgi:hypothetical protein
MKNKKPEPKLWELKDFEREVRRLDKSLAAEDSSFKTAVILLVAAVHGQSTRRLAEFTDYDPAFIEPIKRNMRKARLWLQNGKIDNREWFDQESGGAAFWLHVACAQGYLERSFQPRIN